MRENQIEDIHIRKKYFFKLSNIFIITILLIITLSITPLYSKNITHNTKTLEMMLLENQKKVDEIEHKLKVDELINQTLLEREKTKLLNALKKAQKKLNNLSKKVALIQNDFDNINPKNKILLKAKEILTTQGTTQTINYLLTITKEKQINQNSRNIVKEFLLLIHLLRFEHRHQEAQIAYKQLVKYDTSTQILYKYAIFLEWYSPPKAIEVYERLLKSKELNNKQRAIVITSLTNHYRDTKYTNRRFKLNIEKLSFYRSLAKSNSTIYKPKIANILYKLIPLYYSHKQYYNALKVYNEALILYRELKDDEQIVNTILEGVYYADYSNKELKEAEKILSKRKYRDDENFNRMYDERILGFIRRLQNIDKYNIAIKHSKFNIYRLNEYIRINGKEELKKLDKHEDEAVDITFKTLKLLSPTKKSFKQGKDYYREKRTTPIKKIEYSMKLETMMQKRWFFKQYRVCEGKSIPNVAVVHKNRALILDSGTDGYGYWAGLKLIVKSGNNIDVYTIYGVSFD